MLTRLRFSACFIVCILNPTIFSKEINLQRGPSKRVQQAIFKTSSFHALDGKKIEISHLQSEKHCLLRCIKNLQCYSANIGVRSEDNGQVLCELLSSDKYNSSQGFQASVTLHHFSISSPCESSPCQHGGTCRALYETNDYSCECTENYSGVNCNSFSHCGVEEGWAYYSSSCYKYFPESVDWSTARSRCQALNSSLVTFQTAQEHQFVTSQILPASYHVWIGLHLYSGVWKWVDGSLLSFVKWQAGEPNSVSNIEDCAEMILEYSQGIYWKHTWNDVICIATIKFICERPAILETVP